MKKKTSSKTRSGNRPGAANSNFKHGLFSDHEQPRDFLERDRDGYVHTPSGFLSKGAYIDVVRENPDAGLPEWEQLPVMKTIEY